LWFSSSDLVELRGSSRAKLRRKRALHEVTSLHLQELIQQQREREEEKEKESDTKRE